MPDWTELLLVVLDTNVMVSALISPHGNEARTLEMVMQRSLRGVFSEATLAEYQAVLFRPKFKKHRVEAQSILDRLHVTARIYQPSHHLNVSPHEADNRFLECAEAAQADFLITGNLRHYPQQHGVTQIVNARTFLDLIEAKAV